MYKINLDMSAAQTSVVGEVLMKGYYFDKNLRDLIYLAPNRFGYPHNGGEHSLSMTGTKKEVTDWIELWEDTTGIKLDPIKQRIEEGATYIRARQIMRDTFSHTYQ